MTVATDASAPTAPAVGAARRPGRVEDARLLRGEGQFVADLVDAGTPHAVFLRSPIAAGTISHLDVEAARAAPGVLTVLTGAELAEAVGPLPVLHTPDPDFVAATGFEMAPPTVRGLALGTVRYVGEPVAVVVAVDRRVAEDALELLDVRFDEVAAIVDVDRAQVAGARELDPATPGNRAASLRFAHGEIRDELAEGHRTVRATYRMGRHSGVPLECRGVVASFDASADRVELATSTQVPFLVRRAVCAAAGWGPERLRVVAPDVGGGFGPKANIYAEELVLAVLAHRLRTRVAWIEDRAEHLVGAAHARDQVHRIALTVDGDGRIVSLVDEFTVDLGAHNPWVAGVVANTAIHLRGPYRVPAFDVRGTAVVTNKTPSSQYRGAGRPEACFALERALDAAAVELGLSRVEIRRRNLLTGADLPHDVGLPYRDGVAISLDLGDPLATLERAVACVTDPPVAAPSSRHHRVGVGVACFIEATGRGPFETARVRLTASGRIAVHAGAASSGQGHETTLGTVAADVLGVDLDRVEVREGDTDLVPDGMGSFASRTAVVAGNAVAGAAAGLLDRCRSRAAELLGAEPADVVVTPDGFGAGDRHLDWEALAAAHAARGALADRGPLDVVHRYEPPTVTWTCGSHAAVVEVDTRDGGVRIVRYVCVDEGGVSIAPTIVEGQVVGGVVQGIGGALLEDLAYGPAGEPLSTTLATYLLPTSHDAPTIEVHHVEHRSELNPLGVRGVGESGTIPVYAALASAIDDAFGDRVHHDTTPMTGRRVLAAGLAAGVLGPDVEVGA